MKVLQVKYKIMNTEKYILKKINRYFESISKDRHIEISRDNSYEYIPTELDFIYNALMLIDKKNSVKNKKFLDVGSGVGNVCGIAEMYELIAEGIEFNPVLFEIAKGIYPEVRFHNIDIKDFNDYNDYDIIFYCVPLKDEELQKSLKEKIENQINVGTYIITRGPEIKDNRFISFNNDSFNNQIWLKIKQ